nr:DUF3310 domain-containing protein [Mammaliicoccus sp. Marseille-Q6498]
MTRLNKKDVDFYGTLKNIKRVLATLSDCTSPDYDGTKIYLPECNDFGKRMTDYYTLATDEEDTEVPTIQYINDMYNESEEILSHDPVNKPSHYKLGNHEVKDIVSLVADKYHKGSVAHNVASALEYQMRAPDKNGIEDIKKARKCLDFAIENWE